MCQQYHTKRNASNPVSRDVSAILEKPQKKKTGWSSQQPERPKTKASDKISVNCETLADVVEAKGSFVGGGGTYCDDDAETDEEADGIDEADQEFILASTDSYSSSSDDDDDDDDEEDSGDGFVRLEAVDVGLNEVDDWVSTLLPQKNFKDALMGSIDKERSTGDAMPVPPYPVCPPLYSSSYQAGCANRHKRTIRHEGPEASLVEEEPEEYFSAKNQKGGKASKRYAQEGRTPFKSRTSKCVKRKKITTIRGAKCSLY